MSDTTAITTHPRLEPLRAILGSVYHALPANLSSDEALMQQSQLALTEAWNFAVALLADLDEAAARNTALAEMFDTVVTQRDDILEELRDLHSLEASLKYQDLQDRRLRKFAAEILAGNGEYVALIDELEGEDFHLRLENMIASRLNLGRHAASDLADLLMDEWSDDVPNDLAANLAQAVDDIRQHYRGWKG